MAASGDPECAISCAISSGLGLRASSDPACEAEAVEETEDIVESKDEVLGTRRDSARPMLDFARDVARSEDRCGGEPLLPSPSTDDVGAETLRICRSGSALGVASGLPLLTSARVVESLLPCRLCVKTWMGLFSGDKRNVTIGLPPGDMVEYGPSLTSLGRSGDLKSLGLACTKDSVMGEDICETCKGLGVGLRYPVLSLDLEGSERGGAGNVTACILARTSQRASTDGRTMRLHVGFSMEIVVAVCRLGTLDTEAGASFVDDGSHTTYSWDWRARSGVKMMRTTSKARSRRDS